MSTAYLLNIYQNLDVYLLVVMRILGFFITVPVFGGENIPNMSKIGLSLIIGAILYSTQVIEVVPYANNVLAFGILITKEIIVGLIIGFVVYMIFSCMYLAGQLIDFEMGLSMVSVFDPVSQVQVPVTGNILYFIICMILVITNGHHSFIRAIFYSYEMLPIGGAYLLGNESLFYSAMELMSSFFVMALQIAMPLIGAIFILNVALGLVCKTAPQINIFAVGIILKILVGLYILILILPIYSTISEILIEKAYEAIVTFIRGLVP